MSGDKILNTIHYSLACVKAPCLDEMSHTTLQVYVMYMYETSKGLKSVIRLLYFTAYLVARNIPLLDRRDS